MCDWLGHLLFEFSCIRILSENNVVIDGLVGKERLEQRVFGSHFKQESATCNQLHHWLISSGTLNQVWRVYYCGSHCGTRRRVGFLPPRSSQHSAGGKHRSIQWQHSVVRPEAEEQAFNPETMHKLFIISAICFQNSEECWATLSLSFFPLKHFHKVISLRYIMLNQLQISTISK